MVQAKHLVCVYVLSFFIVSLIVCKWKRRYIHQPSCRTTHGRQPSYLFSNSFLTRFHRINSAKAIYACVRDGVWYGRERLNWTFTKRKREGNHSVDLVRWSIWPNYENYIVSYVCGCIPMFYYFIRKWKLFPISVIFYSQFLPQLEVWTQTEGKMSTYMFCWQPVFYFHTKSAPATSQPAVLFPHSKSALATSHSQPDRRDRKSILVFVACMHAQIIGAINCIYVIS